MERLIKFFRLTGVEQKILFEAFFFLNLARLAVTVLPFKKIAPYLGEYMAVTPKRPKPEHEAASNLVGWALNTVNRHSPWKYKCLPRAIAGKWMLDRRGIPNTLYLGLAKDEGGALKAHAWLRSGNRVLTGNRERPQFTIVSTFA